jgi:hypothetical protein
MREKYLSDLHMHTEEWKGNNCAIPVYSSHTEVTHGKL